MIILGTVDEKLERGVYNKHLKNTRLLSVEFLRTEMTSDLSNWNREYEPSGILCDSSDVSSVLKTQ